MSKHIYDDMLQPFAGAVTLLETIAEYGCVSKLFDEPTPNAKLCLRIAGELRAISMRGPNAALKFEPLKSAGQVQVGDYVKFDLCGEIKVHKVAIVLHAGTDKEEIIYHKRNNWYLITSMSIAGLGSQKNVEFLPIAASVAAAIASVGTPP